MTRPRLLPPLLAAALLAAGLGADRLAANEPGAATPPPATAPAPLPSRTVVGELASVDAAAGTLVVVETAKSKKKAGELEPKRERLTIKLDAGTKILRGKTPAAAKDLSPADHVVIRYAVAADGLRALSVRAAEPVRQAAKTPEAGGAAESLPDASR